MTLDEYRTFPWWPNGRKVRVTAGFAGHDREIVVSIDGYGGSPLDESTFIPSLLDECLAQELPDSWFIENRGTRIEVHPSGRFAGGYEPEHLDIVAEALEKLGLVVESKHDNREVA